jgi:integrase/recombinase XerD
MNLPSEIVRGLPSSTIVSGCVTDDEEAIRVFLASYSRNPSHTLRAYTREVKRFLLWVRATNQSGSMSLLPLVSHDDINKYLDYLSNPRPFSEAFLKSNGWKGQPVRSGLQPTSINHAVIVLNKAFDAWRNLRTTNNQPYCLFNPVILARGAVKGGKQREMEEALSRSEWAAVMSVIDQLGESAKSPRDIKHYHRSRWVIQLLYRAWLRRSEAAGIAMSSFVPTDAGWDLKLVDANGLPVAKGGGKHTIIVTHKLMDELKIYRQSIGLPPLPSLGDHRPAILSLYGDKKPITDQVLYMICGEIFRRAAGLIENADPFGAVRLRKASPHWLRHTGISHAMESGANPRYVQAQARHSSLAVTARYDHKEKVAWRRDMESLD